MQTPSLFSRFARALVLIMMVLFLGIGTAVPQAYAVFGIADTTTVVADLPRAITEARTTAWSGLVGGAVGALFNAMQLFLGQIAYDAANYVASGGKGQSTLFYKKGFLGYFQDVGGDAVGDFIGSLSDSGDFAHTIGINLCKPRNPALLLRLQSSLGQLGQQAFPTPQVASRFQRPRPRCELQEIVNNYENLYETMSNTDVLRTVSSSFDATSNELGTVTSIYNRFLDNVQTRLNAASQDRQEGQGFASVQGIISGTIRTPASIVNQATGDFLVKQPAASQSEIVGAIMNNAWNIGAPQLLWYTASIFTNTLVSKLLKNVFEKGIFSSTGLYTSTAGGGLIDSVLVYGKTDARNANIDLKNISFFKRVTYDALAELQACPTNGTRSLYNCSIDQGLFAAISAKGNDGAVTVSQALEKGYLHPEWQLIPDAEARINTSPTCYSTAYCSGNIKKLRSLRILSAGFEFAANSPTNIQRCQRGDCVKLQEVVKGYTDCNAAGQLDATHPWCHLIDPNWIITSLPQQCSLSGYGNSLLTEKVNVRREHCSDVQTCLRRDENGQCTGGYGYCMAERSVYRFKGDICEARYASCRSYTARDNTSVSYLRYSVDRGLCSADNVGCLWYASQRLATPGRNDDWLAAMSTGPRVYFNKNVQSCPADAEGCTKLYTASTGVPALNLVQNPSFERKETNPETLTGWLGSDGRPQSLPGTNAVLSTESFTGTLSYNSRTNGEMVYQSVPVVGGRTYTLSALAKVVTRLALGADVRVDFQPKRRAADGSFENVPIAELNRYYTSRGTCSPASNVGHAAAAGYQLTSPLGATLDGLLSADWRRFECTFVLPEGVVAGDITLGGRGVAIDAVQLEESEYATNFIDGLNQALPEVHVKVAPEEFNCTGSSSDHQACAKFAQVCRQSEAGCQGYTDITAGGAEIPAILSSNDTCPSECVGYAEYRKSASAFDLARDADDRLNDPQETSSTAFIASTALQCTQAEVGCEAFTVLDGPRIGQTLAYNYLRTCEKPDAASETFFTWEGADTTGYQLRTWSLKRASTEGGPRVLAKLEPDQLNFKEPQTCSESLWRSGFDPDCRQFYNAQGRVYYRYFSQTILSTNECTQLRFNGGSAADCAKTGGIRNAGGECVYSAVLAESRVCRQESISCRRYMGSSSGNVQTVFSQDFRSTTTGGFLGTTSTESLLVGDASLRLRLNGTSMTSVTVPTDDASLYRVTFWAKSPATTTLLALKTQDPLELSGDTTFARAATVGSVQVGPEWQRYTVGLFSGAVGAPATAFGWITNATSAIFIDEVVISRVQDVVYVKKGSWNTPISCDRTSSGATEPQAMLGCRAYRDRTGTTVEARRFTRLCRETAISCRAFVDTRNSDPTGVSTFTKSDPAPVLGYAQTATTTRAADRFLYLIDTPDKRCTADNDSCRAFGLPNFSADRSGFDVQTPFSTVYLKDDITKYDQMLCKPSELFCEAYGYNRQTEYFRDPKAHQCEYRDSVTLGEGNRFNVPAGIYNGWFQRGNDVPCYPQILTNGNTFGLASAGDDPSVYKGWVGSCPVTQSECTEFRDPNDKTDPLHRDGKPYFLIRNDKIDTASCNGTVDQAQGCVLFRDLSDSQVNYSTKATYAKYDQNAYRAVTPIDCVRDSGNELCQNTTNDANLVLKVGVDRDCAQWLGCKSSERVYDSAAGQYRDICTDLALCDSASNVPNDLFCAHYVDRSSTTTEPVLTKGAFFDAKLYSTRKTGLGAMDYSGFAIPGSFQIPDVQMTKVGVNGALSTPNNNSRFANEYRLAAVIRMPPLSTSIPGPTRVHVPAPRPNEARILDNDPIARAYPNLRLCQQIATGRIGYYIESEATTLREFNCYLAVSGVSEGGGSTNPYSFTALQEAFSTPTPDSDKNLVEAFPPSECRAHPEEDSPFPTSYIRSWDLTKTPPKPTSFVQGFRNANFCEYGEDCACTYKRAQYGGTGGTSKFFGVYAQGVSPGICAGGPRDGQSCIPETIFKLPTTGSDTVRAIEGSNASQTCGSPDLGGRCVAFDSVSIVRGNFGACLERDTSVTKKDGQVSAACLTWNPNPLLFGVNDPYHFVPTAGYLPPQNSGQYYCLSPARDPRRVRFESSFFQKNTGGFYAGKINKLDYDDAYVSEGGNPVPAGNKEGSDINGFRPVGTNTAAQCEDTDDDQGSGTYLFSNLDSQQPFAADTQALRLVSSGRLADQTYTETFFPVDVSKLGDALSRAPTSALDTADARALAAERNKIAMYDYNFGNFMIYPIKTTNGTARLGCGYQADWVDNIGSIDYDNIEEVKQGERVWLDKFNQDYNPSLNRGSEEIVMQEDDMPLSAPCVSRGGSVPAGTPCYFKSWSTNYHVPASEKPFQAFSPTGGRRTNFDSVQDDLYQKTCDANKPYFAIRAVFQTKATLIEQGGRARTAFTGANAKDIAGPWGFAGFWVTTCGGQSPGDVRFMYMYVEANSGDICRDLAEVVSRDSHQDAAFTDRVAKDTTFVIPQLGIQYNARYAPFSSALNTAPAGIDPLFQTGQEITGYSPLNPPTFLAAGLRTYSIDAPEPKQKWAYLSNIFARIYRVYRYEEQAVTANSTACLAGPFKGRACVPYTTQRHPDCVDGQACDRNAYVFTQPSANGVIGVSASCSLNGTCDPSRFGQSAQDQSNNAGFCNSLSGLNAGKSCVMNTEICHIGYIQNNDAGEPAPRMLPCVTQTGWTKEGQQWRTEDRLVDQQTAANEGAFRCPNTPNSMRREGINDPYSAPNWDTSRAGQKCYQPTDENPGDIQGSPECPERILNGVEYGPAPSGTESAEARAARVATAVCRNPDTGAVINSTVGFGATGGTPLQGRCDVHVPGYEFTGPNGSYNLSGFDIDYRVSGPRCSGAYDCSFTSMNYHYTSPGGVYPQGVASTYDSTRSLRNLRAFVFRTPQSNEYHAVGTSIGSYGLDDMNTGLTTAQLKTYTAAPVIAQTASSGVVGNGAPTLNGPLTSILQTNIPTFGALGRGFPSFYGVNGNHKFGEFAINSYELNRTPGPGPAVNISSARGSSANVQGQAYQIGACVPITQTAATSPTRYGRCVGGLKDGNLCQFPDPGASDDLSCLFDTAMNFAAAGNANEPITIGGARIPQNICGSVTETRDGQIYTVDSCTKDGLPSSDPIGPDPATDDNMCTHLRGYIPRIDLCPDPTDEFCGLIAYNRRDADNSLLPSAPAFLPTDVTQGLHTPTFLGLRDPAYAVDRNKFDYISVYAPHPPVVASPDKARCAADGQCQLNSLNSFSLNGQSEGPLTIAGGQFKANVLFYAWAAHNQMPLRAIYVDWGDASVQQLPDARMKNRKPYCNVKKECTNARGLTCNKNGDCPPGAGTCAPVGVCGADANKTCRADTDCATKDRCNLRTLFGNTTEACEENYFDFSHLYTCNGPGNLPSCSAPTLANRSIPFNVPANTCYFGAWSGVVSEYGLSASACQTNVDCFSLLRDRRNGFPFPVGTTDLSMINSGISCNNGVSTAGQPNLKRCSRDPSKSCQMDAGCAVGDSCVEGLAPPGGCWDDRINSCRFTPRVKVIDNWGWCTGECRATLAAGQLTDAETGTVPTAKHVYGGCYSGVVQGSDKSIDINTSALTERSRNAPMSSFPDECGIRNSTDRSNNRPWIVYPGSINLRSGNTIVRP